MNHEAAGKRILVLGVTGMFGHAFFMHCMRLGMDVFATARHKDGLTRWFSPEVLDRVVGEIDAEKFATVARVISDVRPDVVINGIGIVKQIPESRDPVKAITLNALFPHVLASFCASAGVRMIHISTDCVFSGMRGNYAEEDGPDADDLYGRTKLLGEVAYPHCITLRTSLIGHELKGKHSLLEWFLGQEGNVPGYTKAIFSGLPTIEMANIICRYVIPDNSLSGLYHVSSSPISKFDLLREVAECYGKKINIEPDDGVRCDRSLDSGRFRKATGYNPPSWHELTGRMHRHFINAPYYQKQ